MRVGDLVKPLIACGGQPGAARCESAIILGVEHRHNETIEVAMFEYESVEVYEYALLCSCGSFEEYNDQLELISEGR